MLVRAAYKSTLISISSGIIDFSSSEDAVQRWVFTSQIIAELDYNMDNDLGIYNG